MKSHSLAQMFKTLLLGALISGIVSEQASAGNVAAEDALDRALRGDHRDAGNRDRDQYRHPKETLRFFGLRPDMTVVEISPGRGWYTEILAPVLRADGKLYAVGFGPIQPGMPEYAAKMQKAYEAKLKARPDVYDRVVLTSMQNPKQAEFAPPGTADLVLTFRNVHNWIADGTADDMFKAMHRALKPGGTLGVVEHRAKPGTSPKDMMKTGYVTEDYVIALAEKAGFKLADKSEINANPKDTKDHPEGVWTLPPALRMGEKDRDRYLAIGESDRMTLKFAK
ncbi:methyltransferase [Methylocaldum sp.]|uniref:class I SAM-dependent methyltransferase n=1 Tax=Methylocaldum sp. TaxID=1969727 RepID=UPI002D238AE5|nr:methyltransferase [Methylocaldum sp.]HYE34822.1 methyltransferase [Methylocaldum sp.]